MLVQETSSPSKRYNPFGGDAARLNAPSEKDDLAPVSMIRFAGQFKQYGAKVCHEPLINVFLWISNIKACASKIRNAF